MNRNRMADVDAFLAKKRIALVGASRSPQHFSRALMRELLQRGYDVVPVNPEADTIEDRPAVHRLADANPPVEAALVMTPASRSRDVVAEASEAGVNLVWLHRGGGQGAVSDEAIALAEEKGLTCVAGECPFMFLPEGQVPHRFHRFVRRVTGRLPA